MACKKILMEKNLKSAEERLDRLFKRIVIGLLLMEPIFLVLLLMSPFSNFLTALFFSIGVICFIIFLAHIKECYNKEIEKKFGPI